MPASPLPLRILIQRSTVVGLLLLSLLLGGCQSGYYWHLWRGHHAMMAGREPVDQVLADPALAATERQQLRLSRSLLAFAEQQLALPVGDAYQQYVQLDRDWVVWNLFAAPAYSLTPQQWCYPLLGCAGYRGYFDQQRAEQAAAALREKGLDVYGSGAIAYSTLGWFADPLTSVMLQGDALWFSELLFHELVHRRYYRKGDTGFNESLATAVAREGVRRWLAEQGDPAAAATLRQRDAARQTFLALITTTRAALTDLYQSAQPEAIMAAQKAAIIADLRRRYAAARQAQPALAGYAGFFAGPLNNAQLNAVSDYHGRVPEFEQLLLDCGGNWQCFWRQVETLPDSSHKEPA